MKKIFLVVVLSFLFHSCGAGIENAAKVLRNEKVKSTDEFLVKKREPLIMPPDYNTLPKPDSQPKKSIEEDRIKKIINNSKKKNTINNKSTSTEDSILKKIRK